MARHADSTDEKAAFSDKKVSAVTRRNAMTAERYRLDGTYERLRRALIAGPQDGRIDQPLSYWVLPTDRRLPIAFLDRPIRELLEAPLEELMATPGVGQKKILGFFDLLRRAIKSESPHAPFGMASTPSPASNPIELRGVGIAPEEVSEAVWSEWCEAIERAGFAEHKLGRIAPSLRPLPTVIWQKRLSDYASLTLAEIRALKTHGEKRVFAILEAFGAVYEAVSTAALHPDLQLDLTPRFVPPMSRWLLERLNDLSGSLSREEVLHHVARPLVGQIEIDLDESIGGLVSERLGLEGPPPTVKSQAAQFNVTRARVYQLLEDCAEVMAVRWPEGRWLLGPLASDSDTAEPDAIELVQSARSLFFPD